MAKFLTQNQIQEFRECFSLYDKKRKGKICSGDLITVLRCLGTSPTPGEVERHLMHHNIVTMNGEITEKILLRTGEVSAELSCSDRTPAERGGELDFSTFLTIIHQQQQQEDPEREILDAMLMADKEKAGFISATELRAKLTQTGEKMTNKEVNELLQEANIPPNGIVEYKDFIRTILLPLPDY